jgi:hypothetical protein
MTRRIGNLSGVQEGFGGDTTHVEARTTHFVLLDEPHAHSQLACAQGGSVTATSRPENDKIKCVLSHG